MTTDLIVTLPHVFAVLVVVGWFLYARRARNVDSPDGSEGSGGTRNLPPQPQLPLIDGHRRDNLARSA
jgi:hypothetical protein